MFYYFILLLHKYIKCRRVASGASAAARLRRLDETAEIIMFERDEHISFANCGLPYYIEETIKDRDKLLVQTPESMNARFNIDVRNFSEAASIDAKNKKVTVKSKDKGTYEESYDYLILSPEAKALKPPIPGIDNNRIFTLRNIADTDASERTLQRFNIPYKVIYAHPVSHATYYPGVKTMSLKLIFNEGCL